MDTAEGGATMATTTGSQMGFTTAPRQFNDGYNIYVEKWNTQERQDPRQRLHDTPHPITGKVCDLALNTFMGDITKTHAMLPAASATTIVDHLDGTTAALEQTIAKCGWKLNAGKTNLLSLRGRGSRRNKGVTSQRDACVRTAPS
eukprot:3148747-Pyramimonas_sp.AAC.1